MNKAILFPGQYIQGNDILREAGARIAAFGRRPFLCWTPHSREAAHHLVLSSLREASLAPTEGLFSGICTKSRAAELTAAAAAAQADVVIGIGGGSAIDLAKAVAAKLHLPVVIIPTIASSDAATSACTVWYNEAGASAGYDRWSVSPQLVLVDTGILVRAPIRFLVAGMGDALATWPEADASRRAGKPAHAGGAPTRAAMSLARLSFDILNASALDARSAVVQGQVTPAFEDVVEANVLLSGIGWESGGLACAHAVAHALSALPETHGCLHGEKVAFGLAIQLCLETDYDAAERTRLLTLMMTLGLPVTFAQIGLRELSNDRLAALARRIALPGSSVHNQPFPAQASAIAEAMRAADATQQGAEYTSSAQR